MAWIGYIVRWVLTDTLDGARLQAFDSFDEALEKTHWLTCETSGVKNARMQRVEHQMECGWSEMENACEICSAVDALHEPPPPVTCGVCDGVGHVSETCRAGDAPYDPREDEIERYAEYWMGQ